MKKRIVIVRHGERVDATFSDDWIDHCFDTNGVYKKRNLNMPDELYVRSHRSNYLQDSPLTQVGCLQAQLVGKSLKKEDILQAGFQIYVSPALRAIETASFITSELGIPKAMLKIEPGLFECTKNFRSTVLPRWMTSHELAHAGFNVDEYYIPIINAQQVENDEQVLAYYERSHYLMKRLLEKTDGDLLLIAHRSSLDGLTRQLLGYSPRNTENYFNVLRTIPYCAVAAIENCGDGNWKLDKTVSSKFSMRHTAVTDFCALKKFGQAQSVSSTSYSTES